LLAILAIPPGALSTLLHIIRYFYVRY